MSGIYRMAPPADYRTKAQEEEALKRALRRLIAAHGLDVVVDRIRRHPAGTQGDDERKAWLVLSAYAAERRGNRSGSF